MRNFILLIIILILFGFFFLVYNYAPLVDENLHFTQIKRFMFGNYTQDITAVMPGYHFFMSTVSKAFGLNHIGEMRFIQLIISIATILIFFHLVKTLHLPHSRGLMFSSFPLFFPFFFLIYTDMLSLMFVLLGFYFTIRQNYAAAGILTTISIFIRQNNVIWLIFLLSIAIKLQNNGTGSLAILIKTIKKNWAYFLGIVSFIIFLVINKGIVLGDKDMYKSLYIYFGNIYFFLFLFFFLFLPLNIHNFRKIMQLLKNKIAWVMIALLFIVYLLTFKNTNPYNVIAANYLLSGSILAYFSSLILLKSFFFLPIIYSALSISVTKIEHKNLLCLFTFLFLIPFWFIQPRYYFIPFTFFIIFFKSESKKVINDTITLWIIASITIFLLILRGNVFPF
ncbi:hypothetical protein J4401_05875 [Candidatus Woesearchaeota archaeon]|nr:hypothetical protein [Candidatus Woesearchaeota archaeon]